MEAPFDHGAWWAQQADAPAVENVQEVFQFVLARHPLFGCATARSVLPTVLLRFTVQDAAKYADAVAFRCVEVVGSTLELPLLANDQKLNDGHVGMLAFVACHHSHADVRARALSEFDRLKQAHAGDFAGCRTM